MRIFAREPAPQHELDRDYKATRPQHGETLYQWATADYFNMNHRTWLNGYTMIDHELKVVPKTEKFMLTAKVADIECIKCRDINQTRKTGEPKIPCIVSGVDGRCALCIVTKQQKWACQSQLPAGYPWPTRRPINTKASVVSPCRRSSPYSPRSTSPAWMIDTTGAARPRLDGREPHQERAPRRSASPVRQQRRYYDQEASNERTEMTTQRKRRKSISAFEVAEKSTKSRYQRASTVQPGSHSNDDDADTRSAAFVVGTPPMPVGGFPDENDEPEEMHLSKEEIEAFNQNKKRSTIVPKERAGTRQSITIDSSSTTASPIAEPLQAIQNHIKDLEGKNSALIKERTELLAKIEDLQVKSVRREHAELQSRNKDLQLQNDDLRDKAKEQKKKYEELHQKSIKAEETAKQFEKEKYELQLQSDKLRNEAKYHEKKYDELYERSIRAEGKMKHHEKAMVDISGILQELNKKMESYNG